MIAYAASEMVWLRLARCKGSDPSVFVADPEDPHFREKQKVAESVCMECPVIIQCATYALENREMHGTWGGKSSWGSSSPKECKRYIERLKLRIEYRKIIEMPNSKQKRNLIKENLRLQKELGRH